MISFKFLDPLKIPETRNLDLDSEKTTLVHKRIIHNKKFLQRLYHEFYFRMKLETEGLPKGKKIEIGSGGGFLKKVMNDIITSDLVELPGVDLKFSAHDFPFQDNELSAIFLLNTLHHIPNANLFFSECIRVLKKGGKVIMIEPSNTFFSRFIYKRFHHEPFDEYVKDWIFPDKGRLSNSNQALPWVVFYRDYDFFKRKFKDLELKKFEAHTPLRYILSGGVSMMQLVPSFTYVFFRWIDFHFFPRKTGCFYTIVLEKK
jgi:SAM-dependent methyltransferase